MRLGHWRSVTSLLSPVPGTDFEDLVDQNEECEAGCYQCLLSYYNQPDHPLIDRRESELLDLLCRLTRVKCERTTGKSSQGESFEELINASTSSLEKTWLKFLKSNGFNLPDKAQPYLKSQNTRPDFAYTNHQTVVYIDGPHHDGNIQKKLDEQITQDLMNAGFTVVRFGTNQSTWRDILEKYTWAFGSGSTPESDPTNGAP